MQPTVKPPKPICYIAGKSGGHILPCITHAQKELEAKKASKTYLFSTGTPLEYKIINQHQHIINVVPCKLNKIPYNKPWLFPLFIGQFFYYFIESFHKLATIKPCKIVSFGGLNSIPVTTAAKILGIPVELYELNVEPGQTILALSHLTSTVHTCFEKTSTYLPGKTCLPFSYPIRFSEKDTQLNQETIKKELKLNLHKKTILILGGSQGSTQLNESIKRLFLDKDIQNKVQVIHQTGQGNTEKMKAFYNEHGVTNFTTPFYKKLEKLYAASDFVICRSGAGSLFETVFFKKKCLTIPLETKRNQHQVINAQAMSKQFPEFISWLPAKQATQENLKSIIMQQLNP